jgi:putative ABC transport system ATP-binding protein
VLVTHDPALAGRCARQVGMRSGRIESAPPLQAVSA